MQRYYTPDAVRAAEAPLLATLPDGALMRRAAFGLADVTVAELKARTGAVVGRRVSLLVGSGDNGGDALFAGAFLRRRGVAVDAVLLSERVHEAGVAALLRAGGRLAESPHPGADLVLDGIVGLRGSGPLRPAAAALVSRVSAPIVAVDTPSGVDPVTGAVDGPAVAAAVTVAFGALKPVHALAPAHCGAVRLIDIGLGSGGSDLVAFDDGVAFVAFDDGDLAGRWPVPGRSDDKYSLGVAGIAAGGEQYPGAAVLSVGAAVRATSAMVRYAGRARAEVLSAWPEVVAAADVESVGRVQAWGIGPGLGTGAGAVGQLQTVLRSDLPVVVDADALTLAATRPALLAERRAPTLITPHAGEFARIAGRPPGSDRVAAARALAAKLRVTVLLKGDRTVIAAPDGRVVVDIASSPWAATPGSGDVLTGICAALLAAGLEPLAAGACAARVHSLAAAHAADGAPTSASRISAALPAVLRRVLSG
jgi:hydroxyethylthiazole kinase-like uncharacterized protein yjeF